MDEVLHAQRTEEAIHSTSDITMDKYRWGVQWESMNIFLMRNATMSSGKYGLKHKFVTRTKRSKLQRLFY